MQLLSEFSLVLKNFDWMDSAACRGSKVDFFPEENYHSDAPKAIAICQRCPVKQKCLEFAVANKMRYGIWGGLNPVQRRQYLRNGFGRGTVES